MEIDWGKIVEVVFPILTVIFAAYWGIGKKKLGEVAKLIMKVDAALADDKLTSDEIRAIVADVLAILGKSVPK